MKLSIGIVGLPNVGKSTLFNLLTKQNVLAANYPFATIDPNVGVVAVLDERVNKLAVLSNSKKKILAVVEFYDIAGLVKGASMGEGLGNQFLSHIRETQAIVVVLRAFKNDEIVHVENSVDPVRDLGIINTELALKDLEGVERLLGKVEGEAKTGKKEAIQERDALLAIKKHLESGGILASSPDLISLIRAPARQSFSDGGNGRIKDLNLLTAKKQLYLVNGEAGDVTSELVAAIKNIGGDYVVMDLSNATDLAPLISKAYEVLDLISFLTTGEDETRAWTIERGTKAPQAAGVIHTDFEKNFIRAEVVPYAKLVEAGSWNAAKQKGWLRVEGKEYTVQDGDVIVVRHG